MKKSKSTQFTYVGEIDVLNPKKDQINIVDIARGLSHICRYVGQMPAFYSVAQHCCLVAEMVPNDTLSALLHDAAEAYVSDVPSPVKEKCPTYQKIEKQILGVIGSKYLCNFENPDIKAADRKLRATEFKYLLGKNPLDYGLPNPIENAHIRPWSMEYAEERFLRWYNENKKELLPWEVRYNGN